MLFTSSDSNTFFATEIFSDIELIKKLLIDNDLSASTSIVFLKGLILEFKNRLNLTVRGQCRSREAARTKCNSAWAAPPPRPMGEYFCATTLEIHHARELPDAARHRSQEMPWIRSSMLT